MNAIQTIPEDEFTAYPATCRVCQAHITLRKHRECPEMRMDLWVRQACCNRCHDFIMTLSKLRDRIVTVCRAVDTLKWVNPMKEEAMDKAHQVKEESRKQLAFLTKKVADLVCHHWRKPLVWEPDFVQMLMDFPLKAAETVNEYSRHVRRL